MTEYYVELLGVDEDGTEVPIADGYLHAESVSDAKRQALGKWWDDGEDLIELRPAWRVEVAR